MQSPVRIFGKSQSKVLDQATIYHSLKLKKMKDKVIISCDIAKDKLDFYCNESNEYFTLPNSKVGLKTFDKWKKQRKYSNDSFVLAFENTGSYGILLATFASESGIVFYKIPALEIKRSMGISRGKDDKIDAKRIADYMFEKGYKLKPSKLDSPAIDRLKQIRSTRDFLVKQKTSASVNLKNLEEVLKLNPYDTCVVALQGIINEYTNSIKKIETEIDEILAKEKEINNSYQLLITIVGVGKVIAIDTILSTDNFTKFDDWRNYASYCGCAPFSNESGKMVLNKRISNLARKDLKANLTSGAKSAMVFDQELKIYKERKLEEGKSKKCITNVIRCKLISRMFAVIRKNEPFKRNYQHNLEFQQT